MVTKNKSNKNEFLSTDPVAVESNQKPITPTLAEVKLYRVPIFTDIQASLTGDVEVYATSKEEAAAKVQTKIDDDMLDDDIEMRDDDYGFSMLHRELYGSLVDAVQIDESGIEAIDSDVDPDDVLREEVSELGAQISWDTDTLAKQKAFLKSLMAAEEIGAAA